MERIKDGVYIHIKNITSKMYVRSKNYLTLKTEFIIYDNVYTKLHFQIKKYR